ncbi:phenylalanine--tRNA ligase subunit beta [Ruminococcaceae bacterium OttesenSCG-928-D13]|nr:phenylalanine--tRNA ligase subunit beta [Ruminococcaceae bacterium OttesenSCG-928-D13]
MKLPMEWAKSFAPFEATPAEFAEKMTMTGSKVETFEREADAMSNVVVGRVAATQPHPDSDHLHVIQVDTGAGEPIQIVTGAANLKPGDYAPVALHRSKLPNGAEIRKGKLRGLESNGMLCSLPELCLTTHDFPGSSEEEILVLEEPAEPGSDAAVALGMDDVTFDFEITPNRPDCLSVRGLAREAAATFRVPFKDHTPPEPQGKGDVSTLLSAVVQAETCNRYSAAMVENVRIKPSPRWLRQRLRHAGVRPINNIVDITNYVMLEYGQPMHAFDYAYVNGGKITVRMAKEGEKIVTLDGIERALDPGMMVIADEKGPIAVAGVMGGEYSGVYDTTEKVVFESAAFDGPSVRATSRRLGLRTESSGRFEKGLDPNTAGPALRRALELVVELDAGDIVGGILDDYPRPRAQRTMPLNVAAVNALLGIDVSEKEVIDILTPLDLKVENGVITIPTARADVSRDCDIAEEVVRFVGYNTIPATILSGVAKARPTARQLFEEKCMRVLVGCGLWQCQTYSFYSPAGFDKINLPENDPLRDAVKIMNPFGEETSIMRTTALPSIFEVAARNWAARAESCAVFEQATEYTPTPGEEDLPIERQKLVLAAYGPSWDYAALKGVAEALLEVAGITRWEVRRNDAGTTFHPGRCGDIWVQVPVENAPPELVKLGTLGEVHPAVTESYDIKPRLVAADLSLDLLFEASGATPQFRQLPKFPAITRDLALVAGEDMPAAEIAGAITSAAGKRLESLTLFDVYTGEKIGPGKKSLAYSLVLRDAAATLTDADADEIIGKVLAKLGGMGVALRQ